MFSVWSVLSVDYEGCHRWGGKGCARSSVMLRRADRKVAWAGLLQGGGGQPPLLAQIAHQEHKRRRHQRPKDRHDTPAPRETNKDSHEGGDEGDGDQFGLFAKTFYDYVANSSMHGLKYVGDLGLSLFERLFWALAFILAVMAAAYFIFNLFNKFNESPVIMSLTPTTRKLNTIPFPAITICNMNNVRKSKALPILKSKKLLDRGLLDDFCQTGDSEERNGTIPTNWAYIQKFMVEVAQPCHEMIVSCKWDGEPFECSDLFNPAFTDEGMCCAFNKVKRDLIFKNPRDLSDLNVTFLRESVDWSPEAGYPSDSPSTALPLRPKGAGSHMGLTIVVDAEIEEYYCSSENSIGFKLLLHNPIETPKITSFGSTISPGKENRIMIKPTITVSEPNLGDIDVDKRQCFFLVERSLRFYRTYTQRNCYLECEANYTLTFCGCVQYYMPKDKSTRICGRRDWVCAEQAKKTMEKLAANEVLVNNTMTGNVTNCNCLPGCFEITYSMVMSASPLTDLLNISAELLNKKEKAYFKENMAVIQFFFVETQFTGYLRARLFGFTEFLSNTGGLLGLFLGFSFLSAVEIGYFISLRIFCSFVRQPKDKEATADPAAADPRSTLRKIEVPFPFTQ